MKRNLSCLVLAAVFSATLSGCSALRPLLLRGPTLADAEWVGVKSGEAFEILGTLDSRADSAVRILEALGQLDPFGVIVLVTPIGQATPRLVLCQGELAQKCRLIPLNARMNIFSSRVGSSSIEKASYITSSDHND